MDRRGFVHRVVGAVIGLTLARELPGIASTPSPLTRRLHSPERIAMEMWPRLATELGLEVGDVVTIPDGDHVRQYTIVGVYP